MDDDDDDDFDAPVITGPPGTAGMFFALAPLPPPEEMERILDFVRRFDEANRPAPYAVSWWDDRGWRWWAWAAAYVAAIAFDVWMISR